MREAIVHIHPTAVRRGCIEAVQHRTGRIAMSDGRLISWAEYHQRLQQLGELPGGRFLDPALARARNQHRRDQAQRRCAQPDPETPDPQPPRQLTDEPAALGKRETLHLDMRDLDGPDGGPGAA